MTPAVRLLKKKKVPFELHQYKHDPSHDSYGLEAVEATGQPAEQVFKTLLFSQDGQADGLAVAVIPVMKKLNLKLAAKANKLKKAAMADPALAQKVTGYLVGGISHLVRRSVYLSSWISVLSLSRPSVSAVASAGLKSRLPLKHCWHRFKGNLKSLPTTKA
ncbi:cys-tRNA(pro) deacylase ybaK [Vibrio sp. JCM 19236]|nr:cys-tRNA(pro) deacylase ybaK [Vibrio sp. JCM 19236]